MLQQVDDWSDEKCEKSRVRFDDFGCISVIALRSFTRVLDAMDITGRLRELIRWLDRKDVRKKNFRASLKDQLLNRKRVLCDNFVSYHRVNLTTREVLAFRNEEWLDDDSFLKLLRTVEARYSLTENVLISIMPVERMRAYLNWNKGPENTRLVVPWDSRKQEVKSLEGFVKLAQDNRALMFTIINTGGHWAVLCFDFTSKMLLFGHSLDKGILDQRQQVFDVAFRWLNDCGCDSSLWTIERFPVSQQGSGSGSCGIVAITAIENYLYPKVPAWTNSKSGFHRIRLLAEAPKAKQPVPADGISENKESAPANGSSDVKERAPTKDGPDDKESASADGHSDDKESTPANGNLDDSDLDDGDPDDGGAALANELNSEGPLNGAVNGKQRNGNGFVQTIAS